MKIRMVKAYIEKEPYEHWVKVVGYVREEEGRVVFEKDVNLAKNFKSERDAKEYINAHKLYALERTKDGSRNLHRNNCNKKAYIMKGTIKVVR